MFQSWRDPLAALAFCAGIVGIWWAFGTSGLAPAGAMLAVVWVAIGLGYGWWIGRDGEHDVLIVELARRLRQHRELHQDRSLSQKPPAE